MAAPISARSNAAAAAAAYVNMMPGGVPRTGPPTNPLLVRDDVGKAKASCYDLPSERFAYGRPGNHDQEGAREVSMHWVSHTPSPTPESTAPDFVKFNKRAATARVTTARDLAFYRKENESYTPRYGRGSARGAGPKVIPSDVMSGFAYGKKVRPSTPIDDVMSHRFAEMAEDKLRTFYTTYRDEHDRASSKVRKIPMTTASRGHALRAREASHFEETGQDLFKLKKFKDKPTKIKNGRQKPAHTTLLEQLLKESGEASLIEEASRAADTFDRDVCPGTPPGARQTV